MKKKLVLFVFITIFALSCTLPSNLINTNTNSVTPPPVPPPPLTSTPPITTAVSQSALISTATPTHTVIQNTIAPQPLIQPAEQIKLPQGFGINVFTQGLSEPRMMTIGPDGLLYVANRAAGQVVRLPDKNKDGEADSIDVVADGLKDPSSLAFYKDGSLYVAETTRVWRLSRPDPQGVFQDRQIVIDGIPGGGHSTRTLLFSPDGSSLYLSIGSSCNVCQENDKRRATIMRYNPDGTAGREFAIGLRNAVGITFQPGTTDLWATDNGRDYLGDNQPPETVYKVVDGKDYGWPRCYAGRIIDPDFGNPGSCNGIQVPSVEMQAHMAPLGLTFYTGTQFPADYKNNLFIALHGSWNRTSPVGYKVMRVPINGSVIGQAEDFATGWLGANGSVGGRPVDVITGSDGSLFISDDSQGIIYRVYFKGQ